MQVPEHVHRNSVQSHCMNFAQSVFPLSSRDSRVFEFAGDYLEWFTPELESVTIYL